MIKAELEELRNKIDLIDESIAKLLLERLDCAKKIGLLKGELNKNSKDLINIVYYDFNRENQILNRLRTKFESFSNNKIDIIFRQIISFCRNAQTQSSICLLGEFNEFDYKQYFGDFSNYIKTSDFTLWLKELKNNVFNIGISEYDTDENKLDDIGFKLVGCIETEIKKIRVYAHK